MIRWGHTTGDFGRYESLLTGMNQDERDQAVCVWTQDRAKRAARAARRRDARHTRRMANLCWLTASVVALALLWSVASSQDIERPQTVGSWHGAKVLEDGGAR